MPLGLLEVGQLERQLTFSSAVSTGIRLNCWKMKPTCSLRQCAISRSLSVPQIMAEHANLSGGGSVHGRHQVQQRRFAGTRGSHQARRIHLWPCRKLTSFKASTWNSSRMYSLVRLLGFDDDLAHRFQPFRRTASPSFSPAGGFTIRSSPPMSPCSMRTPCAADRAGLYRALDRLVVEQHEHRAIFYGCRRRRAPRAWPEVRRRGRRAWSETNATLAFISGRR